MWGPRTYGTPGIKSGQARSLVSAARRFQLDGTARPVSQKSVASETGVATVRAVTGMAFNSGPASGRAYFFGSGTVIGLPSRGCRTVARTRVFTFPGFLDTRCRHPPGS